MGQSERILNKAPIRQLVSGASRPDGIPSRRVSARRRAIMEAVAARVCHEEEDAWVRPPGTAGRFHAHSHSTSEPILRLSCGSVCRAKTSQGIDAADRRLAEYITEPVPVACRSFLYWGRAAPPYNPREFSPQSMSLTPGARLGPYEIIGLSAPAAWARSIARATRSWDRDVAIKFLPERSPPTPDALARFEREAQAARVAEPSEHRARSTGSKSRDGGRVRSCWSWSRATTSPSGSPAGRFPLDEALPSRGRSPRRWRPRTSRDRPSRSEAGEHQGAPDGT